MMITCGLFLHMTTARRDQLFTKCKSHLTSKSMDCTCETPESATKEFCQCESRQGISIPATVKCIPSHPFAQSCACEARNHMATCSQCKIESQLHSKMTPKRSPQITLGNGSKWFGAKVDRYVKVCDRLLQLCALFSGRLGYFITYGSLLLHKLVEISSAMMPWDLFNVSHYRLLISHPADRLRNEFCLNIRGADAKWQTLAMNILRTRHIVETKGKAERRDKDITTGNLK